MSEVERHKRAGEAARSRALFARQRAAELVEQARQVVWSCERVYDYAVEVATESARLRAARSRLSCGTRVR